jgi:hypothetical protein
MKKRAKKKTAKRSAGKKAAKKKTSKKHKKKPAHSPAHHIVILEPLTGPDHVPVLSETRKDKIRWENRDALDHTLTFTIWPFKGAEVSILVPADGQSGWFTVNPNAIQRTYSYGIAPAFPNQGPPDPPQVEIGP